MILKSSAKYNSLLFKSSSLCIDSPKSVSTTQLFLSLYLTIPVSSFNAPLVITTSLPVLIILLFKL